jgi:hypothetical protein
LELFVNTDTAVTASGIPGLKSVFAGSVSSISSQLTPAVSALLPGSYLTRFETSNVSPAAIKSDITVLPAAVDRGWVYIILGVIVLAIALILTRKRMQPIYEGLADAITPE